jgi:hypothetical protein
VTVAADWWVSTSISKAPVVATGLQRNAVTALTTKSISHCRKALLCGLTGTPTLEARCEVPMVHKN